MTMPDIQIGPATFTPPPAGASRTGRLDGFPLPADVGSPFGPRAAFTLPDGTQTLPFHYGCDFPAPLGTPIVAPADGVVRIANDMDDGTGFILSCESGDWAWECYHLAEPARDYATGADLAPGDIVRRGQVVGHVGSTGRSTGPHLHFGVMYLPTGEYRDPMQYVRQVIVAEPLAFPALTAAELSAALIDPSVHSVQYVLEGAFGGGEVYKVVVMRAADTGAVT